MKRTAKEIFEALKILFPNLNRVISKSNNNEECLQLKIDGLYIIVDTYLWTNELTEIEWPDDSKTYPIKEKNNFIKVPEWLKSWTPNTKTMTRAGIGSIWQGDGLDYVGGSEECIMTICGNYHKLVAPYDPEYIGNNKKHPNQVSDSNIYKMNPEELSHIPGKFYKKSTTEDFLLVETLYCDKQECQDFVSKETKCFIDRGNCVTFKKIPTLKSLGIDPVEVWKNAPDWATGIELWINQDGTFSPGYFEEGLGKERTLTIEKNVTIPHGVNWKDCIWKRPICDQCEGKGERIVDNGIDPPDMQPCPDCKGSF